ncbi:hypothetical protein WDM22_38500 [Bradyrhizobium septentrionale]|uniref:hypothetical protein n=1 Tax=Bradyrhizobium septentrionale TaxID=1404411 RepID=UPI0030D0E7C2
MFEIRIEGIDQLLGKLEKYRAQVTDLHASMPQELESWQREDMKRQYPNMQVHATSDQTVAATSIRPRSRADVRQRRHQAPKQHRLKQTGPVVRSNRPILRASLLDQLIERMKKLLAGATKWP